MAVEGGREKGSVAVPDCGHCFSCVAASQAEERRHGESARTESLEQVGEEQVLGMHH